MLWTLVVVTRALISGTAAAAAAAATATAAHGPSKKQQYAFQWYRQKSNARQSPSWLFSTSSGKTNSIESKSKKPMASSNSPKSNLDHDWLPVILLKRNQQSRAFRNGNQLIYGKAIQYAPSTCQLGQLVQLEVESENQGDPTATLLGWGVYNPNSLYRVRILGHRFLMPPKLFQHIIDTIHTPSSHGTNVDKQNQLLSLLLQYQLHKAVQTRRDMQLFFAKSEETDTFRLVNGEGDALSGLAVDIIGGQTGVIMSSAIWCQIHKNTILNNLNKVVQHHSPQIQMDWIWKTAAARLQQDGLNTTEYHESDGMKDSQNEKQDEMVVSVENGIKYATWPYKDGQKTGVYCDQRENRRYLASPQFCRDKRFLDLCCYHGGFSLNALIHGGASHATGVDSSQDAIETCWENTKLNGIGESDRVNFVRSDITVFLKEAFEQQNFFDVVCLDPPKLAPNLNALDKASRKYHGLNRDAIKIINPRQGGWLLTCTCSAAMTQKEGGQYFLNMVQGAALAAGREITLLRVAGAAPCHTQSPISWPAGDYLTAALFRVHPNMAQII